MSPVPASLSSNQAEDQGEDQEQNSPAVPGETAETSSPPSLRPRQTPPQFAATPAASPSTAAPAAGSATPTTTPVTAVPTTATSPTATSATRIGGAALPQQAAPPKSPPVLTGAPASIPSSMPVRRRSSFRIAAATFALGGIVGAGGFGLGQYFADDGGAVNNPVINVAAPSNEAAPSTTPDTGVVPIPNAAPSPLGAEPAADVARILGPSVVQVETNLGQGSGVVYADGLILTNHHVIDSAAQVRIRTSDGRVFETEVLGSDPRNDIAVLSAPGSDLPVAVIGSSAALEPGQLTVAIGSPFQLQQTVTAGIVSSVNRPVPNADGGLSAMIQTDAPINPGNSGGALPIETVNSSVSMHRSGPTVRVTRTSVLALRFQSTPPFRWPNESSPVTRSTEVCSV